MPADLDAAANEIKAHGAGASTFSDWWGYKIEAYDAIPYNAALLNATGRTLATNCEFAKLNAVLHQQRVACYIDMDKQTVWLMQFTTAPDADNVQPQSQILKTIEINPRIALLSAQSGDQLPQQKGQVEVTFYPNGTCDPFTMTLRGAERGSGLEVVVDPVTCRGMLWPIKL